MNRSKYFKLRHSIRASGYSWNWGRRLKRGSLLTNDERFKTDDLAAVGSTLLHPSYDKFENVGGILGVWQRAKEYGYTEENGRTRIYWQNIMRSNVRRDNRVFTHQLTSY